MQLERQAETRHEFHRGEVFAMAGGTINHGRVSVNLLTGLNIATRGTSCSTFNGDVKIEVSSGERYLYPDASVVCGPVETSSQTEHAITNPVLIAEVLSESTEAYDRGAKFLYYQQLQSFREYLLLDQRSPIATHYWCNEDAVWEMRTYLGLESKISLKSLDLSLSMAELYRDAEDLKAPLT